MILVIIIVVAWIVILGPGLARRRSRTGGGGSITHFHRALRTLEHAAPEPIVSPAYRLRSVGGSSATTGGGYPAVSAVPVLTVVGADQLPRPALAFLGDPLPASSGPAPSSGPGGAAGYRDGSSAGVARHLSGGDDSAVNDEAVTDTAVTDDRARQLDAYARRVTRRRRRDALGVLALVFFSTLMIGFIPGAGEAWIVSAIAGLGLAGYVAVLVQLRRAAEERDQKLRYLRPATGASPAAASRVPVYMSGRYAHPSNQAAAAH